MNEDFYKYFILTHQREKTFLERCETKMTEGAQFKCNYSDNQWEFRYGGNLMMTVQREFIQGARADCYPELDELDTFKLMVGEWILSCICSNKYSPDLHILLTKMSQCATI